MARRGRAFVEWMKKARPDATNFKIDWLAMRDNGWGGNVKGLQWDLDDWRAAPRVSGTLKAQTVARDVTGARAVRMFSIKTRK